MSIKLIKFFVFILIALLNKTDILVNGQNTSACINAPDGVAVRNSKSCSKFFICFSGQSIEMACPETTEFHHLLEVCDYPENVDCTACSKYGIQNLPDPSDCSRYFRCVFGERTEMECPPDQLFDPTKGQCNLKSLITTIPTTCKSDDNQPCQNYPNSIVNLADPNDCSRYLLCVYGTSYPQQCEENLYWSQPYGHCVEYQYSDCENNSTTENIPSTTTEISSSTQTTYNSTSIIINTSTPITTILTSTSTPIIVNTTIINNQTESTTNITPSPTTPSTTTTEPIEEEPKIPVCCESPSSGWNILNECPSLRNEYLPVPGRCRRFTHCIIGIPIPRRCSNGRFWDENLKRCTRTRPNCPARRTTTTTTTTVPPPPSTQLPVCCEPFSLNQQFDCQRLGIHHLPVPGRCRRYIHCILGIPVPHNCPLNRFWDQDLNECVRSRPDCSI